MIRRTFTPHNALHSQRSFCGFCGTPLTYWSEWPRDEAGFMSVTVGSLYGDDQHVLEDLNLLPGSSEEEDESEESDEDAGERRRTEVPEQETEEADEEVPASSSAAVPAATSTAADSSSLVVPTLGREPLTRSYRHGTMSGIPWFEEMIDGSRLGRLMRARRGMGASDDDSTKFQWEVGEWHDDGGSGGSVRHMQSSSTSYSSYSSYSRSNYGSSGKRKRGDLEGGSSRQRRTE